MGREREGGAQMEGGKGGGKEKMREAERPVPSECTTFDPASGPFLS